MPRPDEHLPLSTEKPVDEDVRSEVSDHLEQRTAELIAQGLEPAAARDEARRAFGDVQGVTAECRDIAVRARRTKRRVERIDALWQDVMFALRLLRRSPGFAIVAVATLALGIGANTAIFSVINGVLLRPLPFAQSDRIVDVVELHQRGWANLSWANFVDVRAQSQTFDALAEFGELRTTLLGANEPVRAVAAPVSQDFFRVMAVGAAIGRLPRPADHAVGAPPVAVVSQRFWRDHLGANPDLTAARLRGEFDFQVVGVMPAGFEFPNHSEIWYPLELNTQAPSRTAHNWSAIGRLKAGQTPASAQQELNGVLRRIGAVAGADFDATGARVTALQDDLTGPVRQPLLLLLGASGLLLLTACTNLGSTLLARGAARSQEMAVRTAIGAARGRLIRQIFTESVVIAALGCAAGLLVALVVLKGFVAFAPATLAIGDGARLDLNVLAFTAAVSLFTALLFGLLPAIRISDINSGRIMRASMRGSGRPASRRVWSALVATEVALTVVLLIGSGLLLRSFSAVMNVNLGFEPDHLLTAVIDLPEQLYPAVSKAVTFHDRALDALRAIPGVQAAGVINVLPLGGDNPSGGIQVEGKPAISSKYPITGFAVYRIASAGYFDAMRIRVIRGRALAESDAASSLPVIVVNQALAEHEWPGENPLGKRLRVGGMDGPDIEPWATVVGVVHDVPGEAVTTSARPAYYYSYRQMAYRSRWLTAVVRTTGAPDALVGPVRAALHRIDPSVPVEFHTMAERVSGSVADRRFTAILLGAFAMIALLLAGVGIYGVVSYSVEQRTREIGIRIALGAEPRRVGRMVQRGALGVVIVGVIAGSIGAVAVTRVLTSMLFGVGATDPLSFGSVALVLLTTAWLATWFPSRRSTRVDPIVAIRSE